MTHSSQSSQELRNLVASVCDGLLTLQQQQELSSLLGERHELVPEFMSLISIDHLLRQEGVQRYLALLVDENVKGREAATKRVVSADAVQSKSTLMTADWHRLWSILNSRVIAWSGSLAALVLISATIWSLFVPPSATILENHDALWADASDLQIGDGLGNDWLTLESGSSKMAFREGAFMTVEGPATFRILSSSSCELKQGSLSAYVPPEAVGFSVVMSDATVVDLGTAFRIDEKPDGKTQLYVTEGRVRLDMAASKESLELKAGEIAEWAISELPQRRSTAGIVPKTSGSVVFDNYQPASLGIGQYKHDDKIYVYLERPEAVLQHDLRVDIMSPGSHNNFTTSEGTIPAGTRVRSYLIHFSPEKKRQKLSGSITFPQKILGVVCDSDRLNATNSSLGSNVLLRCQHPERGLESVPNYNADLVSISADRKKLSVKFSTESIDHLRVLTAVEP